MNPQPSTMSRPLDVTAAILFHRGGVLIARRGPEDRMAGMWEFPGGKVEAGESGPQCLRREMGEEFGIEVEVGEFVGRHVHHYPHISIRLLAYRARWTAGRLVLRAHSEARFVPPEELHRFTFSPADLPFVRRLCGTFSSSATAEDEAGAGPSGR